MLAPGQVVVKDGKKYKFIRGMGSRSAMEERSGSRIRYDRQSNKASGELLTSKEKEKIVPEGVEGLVEFKGSTLKQINIPCNKICLNFTTKRC